MIGLSLEVWIGLIAVFAVTVIAGLLLARFSPQLKLLAEPGEHRLHKRATPMVGGIAIYIGIFFGFLFLDRSFASLLPSLLLLCAVGALDDRYKLPSWSRFLVQGTAVYLMIKMTGVQLNTLGYLTPDAEMLLGRWSVPLTIFAGIGVINAINMSDGHDGLAGSLVVVVLAALLLIANDAGLVLIALASMIGFLVLNLRLMRPQAKIFMGDAGSTMLGLLLAYLLIKHSQTEVGFWPVTALWLLALPLIDAVAVLLVRPIRGKSPFEADRIHYHHQMVDRGLSVNTTCLLAVLIQIGFVTIGIWAWKIRIADHLQLVAFLMLFVGYFLSLLWFTRQSRNRI